MPNAIMFHSAGSHPNAFWYPWLSQTLEKQGWSVWAPQLPNSNEPNLVTWLPFALEQGKYDADTVLIGHSAGVPLIISILEQLEQPVKRCILVAGFIQLNGQHQGYSAMLKAGYDWNAIKHNAGEFFFIHSDNDPWGCGVVEGEYLQQHLGGELIIKPGEGHFGSDTYQQPYREFPLVRDLVLQ